MMKVTFPSPYGVIFILINNKDFWRNLYDAKFPSPYGVIFILILLYLLMLS